MRLFFNIIIILLIIIIVLRETFTSVRLCRVFSIIPKFVIIEILFVIIGLLFYIIILFNIAIKDHCKVTYYISYRFAQIFCFGYV